jgi:hypothetical protein
VRSRCDNLAFGGFYKPMAAVDEPRRGCCLHTAIGMRACPAQFVHWCGHGGSSSAAKRMPLITVVITLVVVGLLLWLVNNYIPMDGKIKSILNVVVVVAVVIWLLYGFGVIGRGDEIRMPTIK